MGLAMLHEYMLHGVHQLNETEFEKIMFEFFINLNMFSS